MAEATSASIEAATRHAKGHDLDLKQTDGLWFATLQRRIFGLAVGKPLTGAGTMPDTAVLNALATRR